MNQKYVATIVIALVIGFLVGYGFNSVIGQAVNSSQSAAKLLNGSFTSIDDCSASCPEGDWAVLSETNCYCSPSAAAAVDTIVSTNTYSTSELPFKVELKPHGNKKNGGLK